MRIKGFLAILSMANDFKFKDDPVGWVAAADANAIFAVVSGFKGPSAASLVAASIVWVRMGRDMSLEALNSAIKCFTGVCPVGSALFGGFPAQYA